MKSGRQIYEQDNSLIPPAKEEGSLSITHLLYNGVHKAFAVVSVDHNIIIHSLELFECRKQVGTRKNKSCANAEYYNIIRSMLIVSKSRQLVGYSDEILDVVYLGTSDSHIALATNSCDIKLYDIATMNCQLLCGHTDSVLALATSPANAKLLISSGKVCTVENQLKSNYYQCNYY